MGFRQGAFARIWSVNDEGKYSTANVSVSRKNKETNKYDIEFSDRYVRLVGSAHEAAKELKLPTRGEFDPRYDKGVSVKISSCDVTNNYDARTEKLYTNYVIFGFEIPDNNNDDSKTKNTEKTQKTTGNKSKTKTINKRETVELEDEDELPF